MGDLSRVRAWLLTASLLTTSLATGLWPRAAWAEPPLPLPAAQRAALAEVEEDPAPKKLLDNFHFVVSNEKKLDRFRAPLHDLGGIVAGVGTDQNYLFAGWARPEVLVLLDFDRVVVDLHLAYGVFFLDAPDPAAFLDRWSPTQRPLARSLLQRELPAADAARVAGVLALAGPQVHARLLQVKDQFARLRIPTFLTDPDQYAFIVELIRAGRVRALRGDLTGTKAMRGLAAFARGAGLVVRVLYTSNAEEHFGYTPATRDNFLGLPSDERSVVLRTLFDGGKDFFYVVQPLGAFQAWLGQKRVVSIRDIVDKRRLRSAGDVIRVGSPPGG